MSTRTKLLLIGQAPTRVNRCIWICRELGIPFDLYVTVLLAVSSVGLICVACLSATPLPQTTVSARVAGMSRRSLTMATPCLPNPTVT